ncbi:helix-turn-helix domain-containing protein [Streptomyces sp. NPDC001553]|uniref:helix-turn-helix domain-containing protein n=1 Tax=Streptomyces sp. NPDC001553 TaxID=3154385 RepID=UPI00332F7D1E
MLACARGWNTTVVAVRLNTERKTVARWRTRFLRDRLEGLSELPAPGRSWPLPGRARAVVRRVGCRPFRRPRPPSRGCTVLRGNRRRSGRPPAG